MAASVKYVAIMAIGFNPGETMTYAERKTRGLLDNDQPYTVRWTNFDYNDAGQFVTLADALTRAKKACFEATIMHGGTIVGSWSPIGGFREYR